MANGTLKPPPISAPLKMSVNHYPTFGTFRIGVTIVIVAFGDELALRH